MAKVVVIGEVEDTAVWEKNFRTHVDLFRSFTVNKPVHYAIGEGNRVAVLLEPQDLNAFMKGMETEENVRAMDQDGVKRETVSVHVMDKSVDV